jgi:Domain of unknown function (DUF4410)
MKNTCTRRSDCVPSSTRLLGKSRTQLLASAVILLVLVSPGVADNGAAKTASATRRSLSAADKNRVIYISDFELDPSNFKLDKGGITGKGWLLPPPPGIPTLRRKSQDPQKEAEKLVNLMSETLAANLRKAGFTVRRLLPGDRRPTEGLIVSGVFIEMNEGNQMRRALLGFGAGESKMELYVTLAELAQPEQPIYEVSSQKNSGKWPGAIITVNPYVIPLKFGITKNAPEKAVKKTAAKVAKDLTSQPTTNISSAKNGAGSGSSGN